MRLPMQTNPAQSAAAQYLLVASDGLQPLGCSIFKKIACAASLAACAAACVSTGGAACIACLSGLGMGDCIECL